MGARIAAAARALCALLAVTAGLAAQDFRDLPWRTGADGSLQVLVDSLPTGVGDAAEPGGGLGWQPMFPTLFRDDGFGGTADFGDAFRVGPIAALPLLVHGHGGAAALDEAEHRLRKLGIRVALDRGSMQDVQPDPLLDLLRVQWLTNAAVSAGARHLLDLAEDERRDPFVRAAAARAVQQFAQAWAPGQDEPSVAPPPRVGAPALHAGLARAPSDCDVVLGMNTAALPRLAGLLSAWRRLQLKLASTAVLYGGGNLSPAVLAEGQLRMDVPGQLPYELAVRFGNWRVDYALFAVRARETQAVWLHLGGVFQPESVRKGLEQAGIEVAADDAGGISATVYGWRVRCSPSALEAWPESMRVAARGGLLASLHGWAQPSAAPVQAHLPAGGRWGEALRLAAGGMHLQFDPSTMLATAIATAATPADAKAIRKSWLAWRASRRAAPDQQALGLEHTTWADVKQFAPGVGEPLPTALLWRRCVQAVSVEVDAARVSWRCDLRAFPATELVRLLSLWPLGLLEQA